RTRKSSRLSTRSPAGSSNAERPAMDDNIARLAELLQAQGDGKRPKQADVLIGLTNAAVLFHSPAPDCDALADIAINGHRETHRIRGHGFRQWLRHQFFRKTKTGANSDALQVATETIAAKATFEGDEHEVHCRIAGQGGTIYIDLGDKDWKAIRGHQRGLGHRRRSPSALSARAEHAGAACPGEGRLDRTAAPLLQRLRERLQLVRCRPAGGPAAAIKLSSRGPDRRTGHGQKLASTDPGPFD